MVVFWRCLRVERSGWIVSGWSGVGGPMARFSIKSGKTSKPVLYCILGLWNKDNFIFGIGCWDHGTGVILSNMLAKRFGWTIALSSE